MGNNGIQTVTGKKLWNQNRGYQRPKKHFLIIKICIKCIRVRLYHIEEHQLYVLNYFQSVVNILLIHVYVFSGVQILHHNGLFSCSYTVVIWDTMADKLELDRKMRNQTRGYQRPKKIIHIIKICMKCVHFYISH